MLKRKPFRHQADGLRWSADLDCFALFWEMRCGKSLVTIRITVMKEAFPVLLVAPRDVLETWQDELDLEGEEWEMRLGRKSKPSKNPRWVLTSYESLRLNKTLQKYPWHTVILDESTGIKNPKAAITKVCTTVFSKVPCKICLAGYPAPESILEYFCQFKFLNGSFCGYRSFWDFRSKMFDQHGYDWQPKKGTLVQMIAEMDLCSYPLTRKQAGIQHKTLSQSRRVDMPKTYRKVYDECEKYWAIGDRMTKYRAASWMWLSRLSSGMMDEDSNDFKINELLRLLREELKDQKVVIWATYTDQILEIEKRLKLTRKKVAVIYGDVSPADRAKRNYQFQEGDLDYLVCQPKCAKFGRNFSEADTAIYFSIPTSTLEYVQSRDRVVHPAKVKSTLVLHLLTRDTIDEDTFYAVSEKRAASSVVKSMIRQGISRRNSKVK